MHGEGRQSNSIHSHQETLNSSSRRGSDINDDGSEKYKLSKGEEKVKEDEDEKNDRLYREDDQNLSERPTYNEADLEAMGNIPIPQEAISTDIEVQDGSHQSKDCSTITSEKDANLIGWNGPDDENNPKNFSKKKKWTTTLLFGCYAILSPLSSSMIAPCIEQMSKDLHITSSVKQNMAVSIYMAAYIVAPLFIGPCSEIVGRRPVLMIANATFIVFNLLCSRAGNFDQIVAFRFLAGLGGAGPISVGGGALSDVWSADERGKAIALFSIGPLLGPAIGPIAGGFMVEHELIAGQQAWRWVFYLTTMVAAVPALLGAFFLPETFAPVLLAKKVKKMKKETGNQELRSIHQKDETLLHLCERSLVRPLVMITTQPIVIVLALYLTIIFGTYYILLVTFTQVHQKVYNESSGIASLHYLSLALGFLSGRMIGTRLMDKFYSQFRQKNNGKATPEMRLILMIVPCFLIPTGMIIYGWTIQYRVFWLVPDIGSFIFGMGIMATTFVVQTYTIDAYSAYAASALAATTSLRSAAAFGFPLFSTKMYDTLGYGWGNTLLAFLAFVAGGPGTLCIYLYGAKLRKLSPYAAGDHY